MSREFDLREVKVDFISFVPRGANRKKYFLVKEDRQLKDDIIKAILETDEGEVSRILKEANLEGEAAGVMEAAAKLLKAYKDELPEESLQILAKACGLPEPENEGKGGKEKAEEDAAGELSKEAIAKMDPATQAIVKELLEKNAATEAKAEAAEKVAKELKEEKILKEYVAKAEALPHLPIDPQKFGLVLKALGESHPGEFGEIYKVLKAADAALEKSDLFREIGKSGAGETSAEAEVYARAKSLVAKDASLTQEEAICKVLEDDPELYSRYEEEREAAFKKRSGK
ncbi:MAG: hypothetical protein HPY61_13755 [Methanotrichaceae archaeon]|nr:hypothetical protein [Methanotrichaceae archaeon]